ncbi:MAG: zinc ribbon domain-containing protein [Eubacteriales bacterium]
MNCIKCNQELEENVNFCQYCGQNQLDIPTNHEYSMQQEIVKTQNTMVNQETKKEFAPFLQNLRNNPKAKKLMGCIIGVLVMLGIGIAWFLNTPKMVVLRAFNNTIDGIEKEMESIVNGLDVITHFENFYTGGNYKMEMEIDDLAFTMLSDYKNKQIQVDLDYYGFEIITQLSEQYFTVDLGGITGTYGIDFTTLVQDLEEFELLPIYLPDNYEFPLYQEVDTEMTEEVNDIVRLHFMEFLKNNMDIEKTGETMVESDGKNVKGTVFSLNLDEKMLERMLLDMTEEIFQNKKFVDYYEKDIEAYNDLLYALTDYIDISEADYLLDLQQMYELIEDMIYEITDAYGKHIESMEVVVHNQKIAKIQVKASGDEIFLTLNTGKNILDTISLGDNDLEVLQLSCTYEKGILDISMDTDILSYAIEYDTTRSRNNVSITEYYYNYENKNTFTIDTTTKNQVILDLEMEGVNFHLKSEKNSLDKNWFQQSSVFKNVFTLTEYDIYALLFNMMY